MILIFLAGVHNLTNFSLVYILQDRGVGGWQQLTACTIWTFHVRWILGLEMLDCWRNIIFQFPYLSKSCYPIQPVSFHYSLSLLHTSKIFFGLRPLPLNRYEANFIQTALFRSSINNQTWQSFTHVFVQTAEIEYLLKMKINQTNQFCQQIVVLI